MNLSTKDITRDSKDISEALAQYKKGEIDKIIEEEFVEVLHFKIKIESLPNMDSSFTVLPKVDIPPTSWLDLLGIPLTIIARVCESIVRYFPITDEEKKIYESEVIQEVLVAVKKRIEAGKREKKE